MHTLGIPAVLYMDRLLHKTHADALAVHPDDFTAAFHIILIGGKRSGHNDITADVEATFDLDVGSTGAQIFDDALKQLTVGGKMGFHKTGLADMHTGIARFNPMTSERRGWFGAAGLGPAAFHHGITIYLEAQPF